ncbi:MAG TPA: c-type cytochrome [Phycisphaerales bacterium]|nr:c-type cytochrome [Phycisphaerales bacterium]
MPTTIRVIALIAGAAFAAAACRSRGETKVEETASAAGVQDRIIAGGVAPAPGALNASRPDPNPDAGANLFASMNCDGCHGGGAVGWVGPSLADGRWRYGGSDEEVFTSIFYGRPKGMPAYGGVIGTDGVWMLVSYIKAQSPPPVVPTTSWLPGGNATAAPASSPPAGAAAEEKASPSPAAEAKKDTGGAGTEARAAASVPPEQMPAKYGCTACHAPDRKVVGPGFKEVAAKYRGQDVEDKLVEKVRNGGAGVWGQVPMTPNPQVPDEDLHAVVAWILSLK